MGAYDSESCWRTKTDAVHTVARRSGSRICMRRLVSSSLRTSPPRHMATASLLASPPPHPHLPRGPVRALIMSVCQALLPVQ